MQVLMTKQHDRDVEEINLLQANIEMETKQMQQEIAAQKRQCCKIISAENIKFLAEARSKAYETKVIKEAQAYKERVTIEADNAAQIIREDAQARLDVAKAKSQAWIREAQAEERAAAAMEGMRRHEEKMQLAEAMKDMSKKGNFVLAGKSGQSVLDFYVQTFDTVAKR